MKAVLRIFFFTSVCACLLLIAPRARASKAKADAAIQAIKQASDPSAAVLVRIHRWLNGIKLPDLPSVRASADPVPTDLLRREVRLYRVGWVRAMVAVRASILDCRFPSLSEER